MLNKRTYLVLWQPIDTTSINDIRVVDRITEDRNVSLARVRATVESDAAKGHYSSNGRGFISVIELHESPAYQVHGMEQFQIEDGSAEQIVSTINGRNVTRGELSTAFNLVASKNWKDPIDKTAWLTVDEMAMVAEAIIFFTGSTGKFELLGEQARFHPDLQYCYHVTADGYYRTIGA